MSDARRYAVWPEPRSRLKGHSREVDRQSPTGLIFQIWRDALHRLRSYCWETRRRSIRPNFSVHPVGKTMRWIKKWSMQSFGKIEHPAPAAGSKIWCLFFVCFLSRSGSWALCVRGVHSSNKHCVAVYRPISTRFSAFFRRDCSFRRTT